jgi:hypothetical protein
MLDTFHQPLCVQDAPTGRAPRSPRRLPRKRRARASELGPKSSASPRAQANPRAARVPLPQSSQAFRNTGSDEEQDSDSKSYTDHSSASHPLCPSSSLSTPLSFFHPPRRRHFSGQVFSFVCNTHSVLQRNSFQDKFPGKG